MGLFSDTGQRLGRLEDRVADLVTAQKATDGDVAKLKLEAAEIYEKTYRLLKRLEKRAERAAAQENGAPEDGPSESDATDPVTARVLRRRHGIPGFPAG